VTLRVLVVDDESVARKRLARLLGAMPDVDVVGEVEDGADLGGAIAAHAPVDVVLLDIRMPGLSGLDAAALLGDDGPAVVFCTAHADHAVDAFALGAADYVLKPVDAARLQKALARVRGRAPPPPVAAAGPLLPRLALPTRRGVVLLDPHDVTHATLEDELVTVHARDGATYLTDFALADLEERLPPDRFVRVHRKAVVNLACVARLDPLETGGYVARMHGDRDVVVSRAAARELRRRLGLREA
jgi:two-component system, LytTR family, response regulator